VWFPLLLLLLLLLSDGFKYMINATRCLTNFRLDGKLTLFHHKEFVHFSDIWITFLLTIIDGKYMTPVLSLFSFPV